MLRPSVAAALVIALAGTRPDAPPLAGGRIEGTVVLSRALATRRPKFRIYSDGGPGSTPPSQPAPDLKDEYVSVVLYLDRDQGGLLSQGTASNHIKPTMTQRDERFVPHVLPVVVGTAVDFPNEDEVFHNVFSLSGPKVFDLPKYPAGSSRSVTFNRSGVVHVFCHIHTDMSAIVLVLDNPYFIVPDTAGNFSLDGIPAGDYTLVAWHERIKPVTQKVHIVDGQVTRASFNIPLPQPADR